MAIGCGAPDAAAPTTVTSTTSPGPRLGEAVSPVAYDVSLELDPNRDRFAGRVAISIDVASTTSELWLHAAELEIARARVQIGARTDDVAVLTSAAAPQQRGFRLPHPVSETRLTLMVDYTGHVTDRSGPRLGGDDEQGLFRERAGGAWYLYSQAESVFARRILPCFDEPRWKPAWRVTAIVPAGQIALGNAPIAAERALPDGRREVRFAEITGVPSYLVAVAVGPFEVTGAGKLGRGQLPVRIAVPRATRGARSVERARAVLPRVIAAVEDYVGAPLPLAKLDVVAVPEFFGAMENPGLITMQADAVYGGPELVADLAHELAHQWFGNAVTPAWWDQLWLSEAFATWLGNRITAQLEGPAPPDGRRLERAHLLAAEASVDAAALVHPIASDDDIEPSFDTIAYNKGASVLAAFEHWVGAAAFRAAVRAYLAAHAGRSVSSRAFLDALAEATRPEVSAALASNLQHVGQPVVEFAIACGARPAGATISASARGGVTVPVCVRYPGPSGGQVAAACWLAGAHSERALPARVGCPAWLVGNDGGHGYYRTAWRPGTPLAPLAELSDDERQVRAEDVAGAVAHGELPIADALAAITAFTAFTAVTERPHDRFAALAIADAIDPLLAEPVQPAWRAWLARQFAGEFAAIVRTGELGQASGRLGRLVELVGGAIDPAVIAVARKALAQDPGRRGEPVVVALAALGREGRALFDQLVGDARQASRRGDAEPAGGGGSLSAARLELLGQFPAAFAPAIVELMLDRRLAPDEVWPAIAAQLRRTDTQGAAWRALHARFAAVAPSLRDLVPAYFDAAAALCTPAQRAELVADASRAMVRARPAAARAFQRALATIDRCITRRAQIGDASEIAAALAGAAPRQRATRP